MGRVRHRSFFYTVISLKLHSGSFGVQDMFEVNFHFGFVSLKVACRSLSLVGLVGNILLIYFSF